MPGVAGPAACRRLPAAPADPGRRDDRAAGHARRRCVRRRRRQGRRKAGAEAAAAKAGKLPTNGCRRRQGRRAKPAATPKLRAGEGCSRQSRRQAAKPPAEASRQHDVTARAGRNRKVVGAADRASDRAALAADVVDRRLLRRLPGLLLLRQAAVQPAGHPVQMGGRMGRHRRSARSS